MRAARASLACALALLALARGASHGLTFICADGSRTIPAEYVDDDFCDCESDGSDEPRTGACAAATFTCPQTPLAPKRVFASRVRDGVCDCCDGADEAGHPESRCENTCLASARAALGRAEAGLDARAARAAAGQAAHAAREAEIRELVANITQLGAELPPLRARRDALAEAEARRTALLAKLHASGELAGALGVDTLAAEEAALVLARVALGAGVSGLDALLEHLSDSDDDDASALADATPATRVLAVAEAGAPPSAPAGAPGGAGGEGGAEGESAEAGGAEAGGSCTTAEPCAREAALLAALPLGTLPAPTLTTALLELSAEHGWLGALHAALSGLGRARGRAPPGGEELAGLLATGDALALELAERELAAVQARSSAAEAELSAAREIQSQDFGADKSLAAAREQCLALDKRGAGGEEEGAARAEEGGYAYSLCLFGNFTQRGAAPVHIGSFSAWEPAQPPPRGAAGEGAPGGVLAREMVFEGGDECPDGTRRTARVALRCGPTERLVSVVEPATCAYLATVEAPAACEATAVAQLRAELEALERAQAAAAAAR